MLPRSWRLVSAQEFSLAYRRGRRLALPSATVLYVRASDKGQHTKIAVVTSRKLDRRAVRRNLYRRRTWSALAEILPQLPTIGWILVITLKPTVAGSTVHALAKELTALKPRLSHTS